MAASAIRATRRSSTSIAIIAAIASPRAPRRSRSGALRARCSASGVPRKRRRPPRLHERTMTSPARRWTGDAVMLVTALLMGSSYPVAKDVLAVMSPLLYSSSRYAMAGAFLLLVIALRRQPLGLPRRDWLPILLLSLLGVTLFQACWGYGIARTSPSVGSIVMTTTTTFSALFAWMQGRRLSALGWTGIAVAFAGVVLVVNNSLGRITLEVGNLEGPAFWLAAAFCWALYVDRSVPYNLRLGSLRMVAWTTFLGALMLLAVALCFDSLSEFGRLDDRLLG